MSSSKSSYVGVDSQEYSEVANGGGTIPKTWPDFFGRVQREDAGTTASAELDFRGMAGLAGLVFPLTSLFYLHPLQRYDICHFAAALLLALCNTWRT